MLEQSTNLIPLLLYAANLTIPLLILTLGYWPGGINNIIHVLFDRGRRKFRSPLLTATVQTRELYSLHSGCPYRESFLAPDLSPRVQIIDYLPFQVAASTFRFLAVYPPSAYPIVLL